jgi:2-iminobutanoate/2-iminopropanoate deaminase
MTPARSLFAAVFAALAALAALPAGAHGQKQVVAPAGTRPSPTLSPAIRVGDMLFLSGQLPNRGDSTIEAQTKSALEKMNPILAAAGTSKENIVKCTVFLADGKDFAGMNKAYAEFFPKDPPARSTVVVAALVTPSAKLEVECIAAIPKS